VSVIESPAAPAARRRVARLVGVLETVIAVAVLACGLAFAGGVLSLHAVAEESMVPTYCPGGWVVVWHPGAEDSGVGRVVIADAPDGRAIVKRVAAVGGDTVGFDDGRLVRNGRLVDESWLDRESVDGVFAGAVPVPPGTVYLLGDGRERSVDSRSFGAVPRESLSGRVVVGAGGTCPR
jgi:signal peptidase I